MCSSEAYDAMRSGQSGGMFPRPLRAGERRLNPDGSYSTELTRTERVGNMFMNFPSLYMTKGGFKEFTNVRDAMNVALDYEKRSGKKFPRFDNLQDAIKSAGARTALGGVGSGALER